MLEAVILAGGKSRRMGRDKLSLPQDGTTVLQAAVNRFSEFFDKVYISVDNISRYSDVSAWHIEDIYKGCGPMGGLHAALSEISGDGAFLAAADLPFSDPKIAIKMIELCGEHDICITADRSGRAEPLFGYYKKGVLPTVEMLLKNGIYKMTALFERTDTLKVTPDEIGVVWNEKAFENMNYPEDFERLLMK